MKKVVVGGTGALGKEISGERELRGKGGDRSSFGSATDRKPMDSDPDMKHKKRGTAKAQREAIARSV